jgi:hypothetical protein
MNQEPLKGVREMKKLLVVIAALFLGTWTILGLCASAHSSTVPTIIQSFASKEIKPGDTWKIYINASDPSGKMKYIYAEIYQPGGLAYPVSMTRIKPENRKELSGYIYLNTVTTERPMDFVTLNLVVHLGDGVGNFSEPVIFPLEFSPRAVQSSVPTGVFTENNLGPVMIQLRPVAFDGDGGSSFGD